MYTFFSRRLAALAVLTLMTGTAVAAPDANTNPRSCPALFEAGKRTVELVANPQGTKFEPIGFGVLVHSQYVVTTWHAYQTNHPRFLVWDKHATPFQVVQEDATRQVGLLKLDKPVPLKVPVLNLSRTPPESGDRLLHWSADYGRSKGEFRSPYLIGPWPGMQLASAQNGNALYLTTGTILPGDTGVGLFRCGQAEMVGLLLSGGPLNAVHSPQDSIQARNAKVEKFSREMFDGYRSGEYPFWMIERNMTNAIVGPERLRTFLCGYKGEALLPSAECQPTAQWPTPVVPKRVTSIP